MAARPGPDTGSAARDCCAARDAEQGRHAGLRPGVGGIQGGVSVTESCLLNVTFDICARGDVMSPARKGAEQGAIKQEQTTWWWWGGDITPDVEEVIWLYDQTLERMDSGFQVSLQLQGR